MVQLVFHTGLRIGKGEGFADLEWAMMMSMGAVTKDTIVITTVHDCQVSRIRQTVCPLGWFYPFTKRQFWTGPNSKHLHKTN